MADMVQITWVGIAAAGGVVRYVDLYLRTQTTPSFGPALGHAFVSGFSGYMAALMVMKVDSDWATIAAGAGGYLGTQGLDWISAVVKSRVERHLPPPPKDGAP